MRYIAFALALIAAPAPAQVLYEQPSSRYVPNGVLRAEAVLREARPALAESGQLAKAEQAVRDIRAAYRDDGTADEIMLLDAWQRLREALARAKAG